LFTSITFISFRALNITSISPTTCPYPKISGN
jgi:hypothetical protein